MEVQAFQDSAESVFEDSFQQAVPQEMLRQKETTSGEGRRCPRVNYPGSSTLPESLSLLLLARSWSHVPQSCLEGPSEHPAGPL